MHFKIGKVKPNSNIYTKTRFRAYVEVHLDESRAWRDNVNIRSKLHSIGKKVGKVGEYGRMNYWWSLEDSDEYDIMIEQIKPKKNAIYRYYFESEADIMMVKLAGGFSEL